MESKQHVSGMEKEYAVMGTRENGLAVLGKDIRRFAEIMASPDGSIHLRNEFDNPMGARIYVDASLGGDVPLNHHVEFATPECPSARDMALYDSATDAEALSRFQMIARDPERYRLPKGSYHLLKASTDWKGHWWGCHKNFRIPRAISDEMLIRHLALFLITKPIWAGQGGVGPAYYGDEIFSSEQEIGFLFSPRALAINEVIGSETISARRAIICTARFSEGDSNDLPEWKRLQLLESDPLLSDVTVYIEAGLISLIIRLLANGGFPENFPSLKRIPKEFILNDFHGVVRDPTLQATVRVSDNRRYTALELQEKFLDVLLDHESVIFYSDEDRDVLRRFGEILKLLRESPLLLADQCECWWKHAVFHGLLRRYRSTWKTCGEMQVPIGNRETDLRTYLLMLHHQATALDDWGIWPSLQKKQKVMRLHLPEEVARARTVPPSSRAAFRVALIKRAKEMRIPLTMTAEAWWKINLFSPKYATVIEKRDPTDCDNIEKLAEAEEIMQAFLKRRPRIVRA